MISVAVVGGGIAGLSAAFALRERGVQVTVYEADARLGGKIRTDRIGDTLIDAGPDSFLSSKPAALQLIERLGLSDRVIHTLPGAGGAYILRSGRLLPLPEGMTLLVPAEFRAVARSPLLTPLGKARMALDYVIPPRRDERDESIGDFVRRRVGREAFERMAEPLLSGIYAGDANRLSLLSTFPRLREIERRHGGVIRGAIAQKRQSRQPLVEEGTRRTPFVSLAGGLGELIDALAGAIGHENIRVGAPITAIERAGTELRVSFASGEERHVTGALVTAPASAAAAILRPLDANLATELGGIEYVSSATVSLAFDAEDVAGAQAGRGFVVPRAEAKTLTAVTWTSNKFGGRVPDGVALLRAFVGRQGNEQPVFLPDDELIPLVRRELRDILGVDADPLFSRVWRWTNALPQYTLGHPERLARISNFLAGHPEIALSGAAYRGIGIPDVIRDATDQAAQLIERISAPYPSISR